MRWLPGLPVFLDTVFGEPLGAAVVPAVFLGAAFALVFLAGIVTEDAPGARTGDLGDNGLMFKNRFWNKVGFDILRERMFDFLIE